jgi:hypothetical protein
MASSANVSVKGEALTEIRASTACVKASTPVAAVTLDGNVYVKLGSTIAVSASRSG